MDELHHIDSGSTPNLPHLPYAGPGGNSALRAYAGATNGHTYHEAFPTLKLLSMAYP